MRGVPRRAWSPLLRRGRANGTSPGRPWKRALAGMALLFLLVAAVSYLSGKLERGESASRALERTAPAAAVGSEKEETSSPLEEEAEGEAGPSTAVTAGGGEGSGHVQQDNTSQEGETPSTGGLPEAPSLDLAGSAARVFLGLAAVAGLILLVKRVARKRGGNAGSSRPGRLEVAGYTPLGPSCGIYEVRAGNRLLLVGVSERGMDLLGEMEPEEAVSAEDAELLDDEFLSLIREEMASAFRGNAAKGRGKRPLLEEIRWKTARRAGR